MTVNNWKINTFDQLTVDELYDFLKFRIDIFVVEQNCPYSELDNKDQEIGTHHLSGHNASGEIIAYARLLPPGISYKNDVSIGRLAVTPDLRALRIGCLLLKQCLHHVERLWPKQMVRISAQHHLQTFYEKENFKKVSEPYLEDDIPHIEMLRK